MERRIPAFLLSPRPSPDAGGGGRAAGAGFVDDALGRIAAAARDGIVQWETAAGGGLLQRLDGRVKLLFLLFFLVVASVKAEMGAQLALTVLLFLLALASRVRLAAFCRKALPIALFFGLLVPLPAALNLVSGGEVVIPILRFGEEQAFWIYRIPAEVGFTGEGIRRLSVLFLRVFNSLSLSLLVVLTTPLGGLLGALKALRVPDAVLLSVHLAWKDIFLLLQTACDAHLARKSRSAGPSDPRRGREWVADRVAFLFRRTMRRGDELLLAMRSRGFDGALALRSPGRLPARDLAAGAVFLAAGILLLAW